MISLRDLVVYSAQSGCIVAIASVLPSVVRVTSPGVRYIYWRTIAMLCLVLPWLQGREQAPVLAMSRAAAVGPATVFVPAAALARRFASAAADWPTMVAVLLLGGIVVRLLWISGGLLQVRGLKRAGAPMEASEELRQLQSILGTRADVRYVGGLKQPVTFGAVSPVVLLPEALRLYPVAIQRAVLAHELFHVQRHDWSWIVVEELICAVLWFNPAAWWVVSQIQRAREEIVDELAVLLIGNRRSYVEALLAFADRAPFSAVPAFARRGHLFRRIVLISREGVMSSGRIVVSCGVMALVVALGSWYVVEAFPLQSVAASESLDSQPGPLERRANPITPENPIPRRLAYVAADYPAQAAAGDARGIVTLRATVDQSGRVAEVRTIRVTVPDADLRLAFIDSARTALRQWQYDPPASAPIAFTVAFTFNRGLAATAVQSADAIPPTDRPPALSEPDRAVRVGAGIRPPTKIRDVRPAYPDAALQAHVAGVVVLEVRIEPDGSVSEARVLRSIPLLDQAAIDAVRQWRFTPPIVNGKAAPIVMTVTMNFSGQ